MPTTTPTSLSVRSARFCPSACLPDGLFYSHPTRRVMRDASCMEKKTEFIKVWMPESLKVHLMHLAADDNRALSEYIAHVLVKHVYGHARPPRDDQEGANRDGAGR